VWRVLSVSGTRVLSAPGNCKGLPSCRQSRLCLVPTRFFSPACAWLSSIRLLRAATRHFRDQIMNLASVTLTHVGKEWLATHTHTLRRVEPGNLTTTAFLPVRVLIRCLSRMLGGGRQYRWQSCRVPIVRVSGNSSSRPATVFRRSQRRPLPTSCRGRDLRRRPAGCRYGGPRIRLLLTALLQLHLGRTSICQLDGGHRDQGVGPVYAVKLGTRTSAVTVCRPTQAAGSRTAERAAALAARSMESALSPVCPVSFSVSSADCREYAARTRRDRVCSDRPFLRHLWSPAARKGGEHVVGDGVGRVVIQALPRGGVTQGGPGVTVRTRVLYVQNRHACIQP
jgi:hypothetical protein